MKQQAITSYFNRKVKTECNEVNIKEEVDLDWDEKDNFYETTLDNIKTESPSISVSEKPADSKTEKNIATEKTKNINECPKCKKTFKSIPSFKWHVHYCLKESKLQCAYCAFKTKYRKSLNGHISQIHPKGGDAQSKNKSEIQKYCQKCEKQYGAVRTNSCTKCDSKLLFRCPLCNKTFDASELARYHWATRCGVTGYYHCHLCDYKTVFRGNVVTHLKRIHHDSQSSEKIQWKKLLSKDQTRVLSSYECPKCLKPLRNAHRLKAHVPKCHAENGEKLIVSSSTTDPHRCSKCRKKFAHIYLLNKHISYCMKNQRVSRRLNNESDDEYIEVVEDHPPVTLISADEITKGFKQRAVKYCDKCREESEFEKTWWKNDLDQKLQCSKCETILVYKCKKCLKGYPSQHKILQHLKYICYPEDQFKCTKCNFKTTNAYRVREHYKSKHEGVSSECEKCGKKFMNLIRLKTHMKLCGIQDLKFQCDHCPYRCKLKQYMHNHMIRNHIKPAVVGRSESLKITAQRFSRTLIHLKAHCSKCKNEKRLHDRLKTCGRCKTKLTFKCNTCKKKYNVDDDNACDHVKAYLETIKFECKRCGIGSISKIGLQIHKTRCGAKFPCRFCKYFSNVKGITRNHEKSKHPNQV